MTASISCQLQDSAFTILLRVNKGNDVCLCFVALSAMIVWRGFRKKFFSIRILLCFKWFGRTNCFVNTVFYFIRDVIYQFRLMMSDPANPSFQHFSLYQTTRSRTRKLRFLMRCSAAAARCTSNKLAAYYLILYFPFQINFR